MATVIQQPTSSLPQTAPNQPRLAGWLCGATIFLSAFLLFLVQPVLGKMVLPWFGGAAGVWAACLVYFQASLLAGYAYAHWVRRYLSAPRQAQLHTLLLAASLLFLPIVPSLAWRHPGHLDPALRVLGLLAATVGLPCVLISSTSPLIQAWYADLQPGKSAYRLYALSNLGSMLGLLSFPLFFEPRWPSTIQAHGWSAGYGVFALLCVVTGWYAAKRGRQQNQEPSPGKTGADSAQGDTPPTPGARILWLALAACGSALLLAVTNHLSQNVAPIPLLWVLPLALYLLSFVLCFETERVYQRVIWVPVALAALLGMAYITYVDFGNPLLARALTVFLLGLFVCCMVCHGELARLKPPARYLTSFYLSISGGGVLGGLFVALVAPHIFSSYVEMPLLLAGCAALITVVLWRPGTSPNRLIINLNRGALTLFTIALSVYLVSHKVKDDSGYRLHARNFYGVLRVEDQSLDDEENNIHDIVRVLAHGTIEHGSQMQDDKRRREPTSYYVRTSGVGLALQYAMQKPQVRVGVVGLGAGVVASYCRAGDIYRYYEINPLVEPIARTQFTFLADCPGQLQVLLGDARLTMESQEPQNYDVLAVDAFSGDAIPVHLLTVQAVREYFRHLRGDGEGILAVHVSNKYMDLVPVVAAIAQELHKHSVVVEDPGHEGENPAASTWVLLASNGDVFDGPIFDKDTVELAETDPKIRVWTDDYSNLFQVLDLKWKKKAEPQDGQ